jgi:hypothetical protein
MVVWILSFQQFNKQRLPYIEQLAFVSQDELAPNLISFGWGCTGMGQGGVELTE